MVEYRSLQRPRHIRPRRKTWLISLISIGLVMVGAGGFGLYVVCSKSKNPIPQTIRAKAPYPLYYPTKLPDGWQLDKKSFYIGRSVVGYVLKGPVGNLSIAIEPKPANFDFNAFYNVTLHETIKFPTPNGQGAIGKAENRYIGSVTNSRSWILASPSSEGISPSDMSLILSHLKKSAPLPAG